MLIDLNAAQIAAIKFALANVERELTAVPELQYVDVAQMKEDMQAGFQKALDEGVEMKEIRAGQGSMPYGSSVYVKMDKPQRIAEYLTALADVLKYHAVRDNDRDEELRELRGQRDAVRAFFGTVQD